MPGISFVCDFTAGLREKNSMILSLLDSLLHMPNYKKKILLNDRFYFLGCTQYDEYPLLSLECGEFRIYIEGKIYGKHYILINAELSNLAASIFEDSRGVEAQIKNWLLNTDGDFVVFIFHMKSNRIVIFNDALGRLPLYYARGLGGLVVSRELRFIANLKSGLKFDRMAIAQYLLFSYPLGDRTLLEDIYRLKPSSLITINLDKSQINIGNSHSFNFEAKKHDNNTLKENASQLVSLFSRACIDRTHTYNKNILSLSGGLDSRSVAACLHKNKIPFSGVTRLDIHKVNHSEVKIAKQVASTLGIELKPFCLDYPKGRDYIKLLKMKNGLNSLGMSFILPFHEQVKKAYGSNITFLTGDGGDKLIPDITPFKEIKTIDELINYLISNNQIFSLNNVASLTQIRQSDIIDELKRHITTYPESEIYQKYVHFVIHERGLNFLFEGEDRNRFYFWSVSPFYSIQFFEYAMNCPDWQKSRHALYREFLLRLSAEAASIVNSNWGISIMSKRRWIKLLNRAILNRLSPGLKKNIKRAMRYESLHKYKECIMDQMNSCEAIRGYISSAAFKKVIDQCDRSEIMTMLTVASSVEEYECGGSTLEKYYESDFI